MQRSRRAGRGAVPVDHARRRRRRRGRDSGRERRSIARPLVIDKTGRPHRRGPRASACADAIAELGYRPNALAKTLVSGTSTFIGLVADAIATTPFAGQIIHGAQDEAWKHGYVLLVANTEGNREAEDEAIAMMLEHQVRGILYSTWYHRPAEIPPALLETDVVLVDCFSRGRRGAGGRARRGAGRPHRHRPPARSRAPPHRVHQHDDALARARRAGFAGTARRLRPRASRSTRRSCSMHATGAGGRLRRRRADSSTAARLRSSATTTGWPWASTTACASAGCPSRRTSPWSASTTRKSSPPTFARRSRRSRCRTTSSAPPVSGCCSGLEATPEGGRLEVGVPARRALVDLRRAGMRMGSEPYRPRFHFTPPMATLTRSVGVRGSSRALGSRCRPSLAGVVRR